MKVSVITVCYDSVATIESTIKSVISQNYNDLEYIVVDGGSTDGTHAIIDKYKDSFTHIIIGDDHGIYDAMNKGISISKGDVLCILNSDDVFFSYDVISRVANDFLLSPNVDAVLTDVFFTNCKTRRGMITRVITAKGFRPWKLRFGWMPPHPGIFLKRGIYDKYGGYKLSYQIAADYEFMVRIFLVGNGTFFISDFISVSMREGGVSTRGVLTNHLITKEIVKSCFENNIYTNYFLVSLRLPIKYFKQVFFRKIINFIRQ